MHSTFRNLIHQVDNYALDRLMINDTVKFSWLRVLPVSKTESYWKAVKIDLTLPPLTSLKFAKSKT
jgi:hypothetical protein